MPRSPRATRLLFSYLTHCDASTHPVSGFAKWSVLVLETRVSVWSQQLGKRQGGNSEAAGIGPDRPREGIRPDEVWRRTFCMHP